MIPLTQKITSLGEAMIGKTNIDQFKKMQLESVFQKFTESDCNQEEPTRNKVSNLVLMTLQDDKQYTDCWNAFGKFGWSKAFQN